ncbi:sulfatase family protein [Mucisphaera calidilacus]|uniref:Arylsulfatase n=1 Tax=Mucisphaera calidilacus TaxID=2527982 RepID=A0A518BUG3_9BACT|nr:sulfatase-like hydrolase/transferase [Mucisphaera calidilacus]QDU70618.1 Arylsulfatase [Mucisphaera calidilacus]
MPESQRPNILLLMTDQQRHDTVAALGNNTIKTPSLDRLCAEGTAFTRAYSPTPVCVAARCALMTGKPAHETGCYDNTDQPQDVPSFAEVLADAGYQTHAVGKMHFTPDPHRMWGFQSRDVSEEGWETEPNDDFRNYVRDQGYDHVSAFQGIRSEFYYVPQPSQLPARHHHTHWTVDRSIDFLKRRDTSRPFLLKTSFIKPHPPFENPEPWSRLYRGPQMPAPFTPETGDELTTYWNRVQNRYKYGDAGNDGYLERLRVAAYYANISFIDQQVGRLLDALGDERDNTIVIYFADHGEFLGDYGCYGKRTMQDAASRIPMIVRMPGRVPAGQQVTRPATILDIFPTLLDAAGISSDKPSDEGESLIDLANDNCQRDVVFSQFQMAEYGLYMAVSENDKYVYSAPDRREIYVDDKTDPRETRNAINVPGNDRRAAYLRQKLIDRHSRANDTYAVTDGRWRQYPPVTFDSTPDRGLLYQDNPALQAAIDDLGPGYARDVTTTDGVAMSLLCPETSYPPVEEEPAS